MAQIKCTAHKQTNTHTRNSEAFFYSGVGMAENPGSVRAHTHVLVRTRVIKGRENIQLLFAAKKKARRRKTNLLKPSI